MKQAYLKYISLLGILAFVLLYFLAASKYPGGSDHLRTADSFSWQHNYWCELMDLVARNGMVNTARQPAIVGMFCLAVSLGCFWGYIPCVFPQKPFSMRVMKISGILSTCSLPLFFSGRHDLTVNLAGLFGSISILILLFHLWKKKMSGVFFHGIACVVLLFLNNYIYYYNTNLLYYLPVVQKISFVIFLTWFVRLLLLKKKSTATSSP